MPAPTPAPERPPIRPPAAAPMAVPTAALFTALLLCVSATVVPPIDWKEYWRHSLSSKRNWSKLFPEPGRTITLGPVGGGVAQPAKSATALSARIVFFITLQARAGLLARRSGIP